MATLLSSLETQARRHLQEGTASFWSSAELIDIANQGIKDLWGGIVDLNQEHYQTIDITGLAIAASSEDLTGVPTDCFRVTLIEPKVVSSLGTYRQLKFIPRKYNSPDFIAARQMGDVDAFQDQVICYDLLGAGAPVGAPTIKIAPTLSAAIAATNLRLGYVPTLAAVAAGGNNPVPGEADNALIAWIVAYAKAKEREDGAPDPNWLSIYATEKQNVLVRLTPRQTQEPEYVEALFQGLW